MGQDINPMAAQIARLRLFVSLHAAEQHLDEPEPLPNLEARIVCADSLRTHPISGYNLYSSPAQGKRAAQTALVAQNQQVVDAVRRIVAIREEWTAAHSEAAKQARRVQDRRVRAELRQTLSADALADFPSDLRALADHPLLELDHDEPALMDPRLLFAQDEERLSGFDIVIGNPPYQLFSKSGIGKARRRELEERG